MGKLSLGRARIEGKVPLLVLFGFLAGTVNGLLGAGGGILVVYAMAYALRGAPSDSRDLYANALCVMLPISVLSCVRYAMSGNLRLDGFTRFAVPALIGGVVGGFLLGRLRVGALKALFAALVIYSGIVLVVR